jgi:archaellum biogenesis ATPase FlaH
MLETLHLKNVGPAKEMKLEFAPRLNVITGDNGLGKSFILDCAWFAITQTWSQVVNPKLLSGSTVLPRLDATATIEAKLDKDSTDSNIAVFQFQPLGQFWYDSPNTLTLDLGIVIQSYTNGEFAVFDSIRHLNPGIPQLADRFFSTVDVFTESQVWTVTQKAEGLIRDVANWQRENGETFQQFKTILESLSSSFEEKIELGELTPVRLEDSFDTPTIKMPYGEYVPITQASSGIRKIFAFAYILVWSWRQHQRTNQILKHKPIKRLTFLIDEVESHLHPRWQRVIVQSLLDIAKALSDELQVQIIITTHSPLVMQSLETVFDSQKDAWFDLDFDTSKKEVVLEKRDYFKRGSLNNWITSAAFDLPSSYTPEAKAVMDEVSDALKGDLTFEQAQALNAKLQDVLGDMDVFWVRWHSALERRGLEL